MRSRLCIPRVQRLSTKADRKRRVVSRALKVGFELAFSDDQVVWLPFSQSLRADVTTVIEATNRSADPSGHLHM